MPSSLMRPCWNPQVFFCSQMPYVKFNKVFFGGLNVRAHSLIYIRREKDKIH